MMWLLGQRCCTLRGNCRWDGSGRSGRPASARNGPYSHRFLFGTRLVGYRLEPATPSDVDNKGNNLDHRLRSMPSAFGNRRLVPVPAHTPCPAPRPEPPRIETPAGGARRDRGCAHVDCFIGHTGLRFQVSRDRPFIGESGVARRHPLSFGGYLVQTRENNRQPHAARFDVVSGSFRDLQIHAEPHVFGSPAGSARVGDTLV